jgi:excisionase family DNA binding protein
MRRRTVPDGTPMPSPPPPQPSGPTGPGRIADDYLTVEQVAALWNCGVKTVYRRIYMGELPWVDLRAKGAHRARIRIRRSAAHEFMSAREHAA